VAVYHDFKKPFRILEGKKVGDLIDRKNHRGREIEFCILGSERWLCGRGFGHIVALDGNPDRFRVVSIPWQNRPRSE
jgi:hypothetical protein